MDTLSNQSIELLYRDSFPAVAGTLRRMGADLNETKDIFHDALLIYLEKYQANALAIRSSPQAYLAGVARILWIRKSRLEQKYESLSEGENDPGIPEDFYSMEEKYPKPILQHLQAAGQKCLELLQTFYYEQRSMQEVAEKFGYKTKHSATVQKHKCLEKVRNSLKTAELYEETVK